MSVFRAISFLFILSFLLFVAQGSFVRAQEPEGEGLSLPAQEQSENSSVDPSEDVRGDEELETLTQEKSSSKRRIGYVKLSEPLTPEQVEAGIKMILRRGVHSAAQKLGVKGGFFNNEKVRLNLPDAASGVELSVRDAGDGHLVDALVESMNTVAERSIPRLAGYFLLAVDQIEMGNPKKVNESEEKTPATLYLHRRMAMGLVHVVRPLFRIGIAEEGVVRDYEALIDRYDDLPFEPAVSFNVEDYIVGRVLEAFFIMMGEEEEALRSDPFLCIKEEVCKVLAEAAANNPDMKQPMDPEDVIDMPVDEGVGEGGSDYGDDVQWPSVESGIRVKF
ncbi:MAG: DUF4197 domain-containing protein [Alphaproteobacteria bacterium]